MKKLMLLLICIVGGVSLSHAQTVDDFVVEQRGDTLVVKDFIAMGDVINSLPDLVAIDSTAPDTRVYELVQGGYYYQNYAIAISGGDRPLVIAGEDDTPHVMSTNETSPPRILGSSSGGTDQNGGFIFYNTNVTIKNLISGAHSQSGSQGWSFADAQTTGISFTMDNVYMEHTNWIYVQSNGYAGNSLTVSDSYFVNMNGNGCRRNGGVYDNTAYNTDEILVENSTHVMGAGMIYKFRQFPVNKVVFNHNTFVNISNAPISTSGYQIDMAVTNNLFVNTNVQPYYPSLDGGETDQDYLPTGIINVDSLNSTNNISVGDSLLPAAYQSADPSEWAGMRKILVDNNAVYWSPEMDDIVSDAETQWADYLDSVYTADEIDNGQLMSAMVTMNDRTQAMFDNDEDWPFLTEGRWLEGNPQFTEDFGLLDEAAALGDFIEFTIESVDGGNALQLASVRASGNEADVEGNFAFSDWPIPFDLSYSNSAFLSGGVNGYPIGDLNWYPDQKETWELQAADEYDLIDQHKEDGETITSIERVNNNTPQSIKLSQNYPNPFNPTTNISFNLPKAQEVTLKVYDMLGREVATLLNNEFATSGQNNVNFNASNLASGVYIYRLHGENFSMSKRMTLMK